MIDINTKSLLHFTGTNGQTTYTDEAGHTWAGTSANISTADFRFGPSSLKCNNGGISVVGSVADFAFTENFTIDIWARRPDQGDRNFLYGNFAQGIYLDLGDNVREWVFRYKRGGAGHNITGTTFLLANTWYHLAIVRSGVNLMAFLNGKREKSNNIGTAPIDNLNSVNIGYFNGLSSIEYNGNVDEFRYSDVARWREDFTPHNNPYETKFKQKVITIG